MLLTFPTKKLERNPALAPVDFYRFRHTTELVSRPYQKVVIQRPLWIVGVSPFDTVTSPDEGHVVHLGAPQFTARWSMSDETIRQIATPDFYDGDFNILIYETSMLNGDDAGRIQEWLVEAACAVAYTKGLIAIMAPEEAH